MSLEVKQAKDIQMNVHQGRENISVIPPFLTLTILCQKWPNLTFPVDCRRDLGERDTRCFETK